MTTSSTFTEADIRAWVGEQSLSRGRGYARNGSIIRPRRQGAALKAQCIGSAPSPYRVEVTLTEQGISAGACSCPVGGGGHCKHAAALLLTWLDDPDSFAEVEEVTAALDKLTKQELINLVGRMIDRYPDLENLLELTLLSAAAPTQALDPVVIERQVAAAFNNIDYEYGGEFEVAEQLDDVKALGDEFAKQAAWQSAAAVYKAVVEGVLKNYEMFHDESGELADVVNDCVGALEPCLANAEDEALRELILRTLFDTYHWDVEFGGIDMGYEATDLIVAFATPAEKQKVAQWVRQAMPSGDGWSADYHRRSFGGFLLVLEQEELDDEDFLHICRETGRIPDLVDRLLTLQRVEQAADAARQSSDYALLMMEPIFVEQEQQALFEKLMTERLATTSDRRILEWLKTRAVEKNDPTLALTLAEKLFWAMPTLEGYQDLKPLAQQTGTWPALQKQVMAQLRSEPRHNTLLTEVYLAEGEIDKALAQVTAPAKGPRFNYAYGMQLEVARAAEATRPHAAIDLYLQAARQRIDQRNRNSYAEAATYLTHVRRLYRQLNDEVAWQRLIEHLRTEHRTLRAMQDEFDKAKL